MAKYNELTYDVREGIKEYTDDSEVDDRYIMYLYGIKRAKYLRQDLNNAQKTNDNSIQQTFCIGLEEVSINECNIQYDCDTILRTKKPIPIPIELHTKVAINRVKPTKRISIPFSFISKERASYVGDSPYSKSIYAFIDTDNYIYLYSKNEAYKLIECLSVTGVFADPLSLSSYCDSCEGCDSECYDEENDEYPLQPHYIDLIREEIVMEYLKKLNIPTDKTNDGEDTQA